MLSARAATLEPEPRVFGSTVSHRIRGLGQAIAAEQYVLTWRGDAALPRNASDSMVRPQPRGSVPYDPGKVRSSSDRGIALSSR